MPWAKIDDGFDEGPKVEALCGKHGAEGVAALGLWVLALTNCARRLTDGVVTLRTVRMLDPDRGVKRAELLIEAGLWRRDGDDFQVNDYLDYNPSRESVLKRRAEDADRKARGRNSESRKESARTPAGHAADSGPGHARPGPVPEPDSTTRVVSLSTGRSRVA